MADLDQLADDAAEAVLEAIKYWASRLSSATHVQGLAYAYALVVTAREGGEMPEPPITPE